MKVSSVTKSCDSSKGRKLKLPAAIVKDGDKGLNSAAGSIIKRKIPLAIMYRRALFPSANCRS